MSQNEREKTSIREEIDDQTATKVIDRFEKQYPKTEKKRSFVGILTDALFAKTEAEVPDEPTPPEPAVPSFALFQAVYKDWLASIDNNDALPVREKALSYARLGLGNDAGEVKDVAIYMLFIYTMMLQAAVEAEDQIIRSEIELLAEKTKFSLSAEEQRAYQALLMEVKTRTKSIKSVVTKAREVALELGTEMIVASYATGTSVGSVPAVRRNEKSSAADPS